MTPFSEVTEIVPSESAVAVIFDAVTVAFADVLADERIFEITRFAPASTEPPEMLLFVSAEDVTLFCTAATTPETGAAETDDANVTANAPAAIERVILIILLFRFINISPQGQTNLYKNVSSYLQKL